MKKQLIKIGRILLKARVILISLLLLVAIGLALLEVQNALNPVVDDATLAESRDKQIVEKVNLDLEVIEQIKKRENSGGYKPDTNPFAF